MAWKPVGVDETSNFPTRVKNALLETFKGIFAQRVETRTGAQTSSALSIKEVGNTGYRYYSTSD
ncbi:hypothetical protein SEA_GIANTSBANE_22 [Arthrobacter phage Giantsbane]|nr:hypothetical protein SEA_GIANTSBANE_22 [Arthrobacter phage Giantsbane]